MFRTNTIFIATVILLEIILIFALRSARSFFAAPGIGMEQAIGYTQYFQYPLYFDFIFFFLLCFIPVAVSLLFGRILRRHVK